MRRQNWGLNRKGGLKSEILPLVINPRFTSQSLKSMPMKGL